MGTNLIPSMKETLFGPVLSNMEAPLVEIAELGLDYVFQDGILKDIPVLNLIAGLCRTGVDLWGRNLVRQTATFIKAFNEGQLSEEQIAKHKETLDKDAAKEEKELGRVMLLLDRHIEIERSRILGNFYSAYVAEKIQWEEFVDISDINARMLLGDYSELKSINESPIEQQEKLSEERDYRIRRLEAFGLVYENRARLFGPNRLVCPDTNDRFVTTRLGKIFVEFMD